MRKDTNDDAFKDTKKNTKNKKVYLFCCNEKSVINNSVVRTINALALFLTIVLMFSNEGLFSVNAKWIVIAPLVQSVICVISLKFVDAGTQFYEWDYTERKKRKRFYANYLFILIILSGLFVMSSLVLFSEYSEGEIPQLGLLLLSIPPLLFAFNIFNAISLFYPLFSEDLTLGYKIQKRPEHWQEDGREIGDDMLAEEIMYRDFGVNL